jgi:hypothetical protein
MPAVLIASCAITNIQCEQCWAAKNATVAADLEAVIQFCAQYGNSTSVVATTTKSSASKTAKTTLTTNTASTTTTQASASSANATGNSTSTAFVQSKSDGVKGFRLSVNLGLVVAVAVLVFML